MQVSTADSIKFREITEADDAILAGIIRTNLEAAGLDIPGTAYFDPELDHLSRYYLAERDARYYYIATRDGGIIGGIGLSRLDFFDDCAELQKLYLTDSAKGSGIGYIMIELIEEKARELGYKKIYLETHTSLQAAIHIYEKCGYKLIDKPKEAVHSTMNRFFIKDL